MSLPQFDGEAVVSGETPQELAFSATLAGLHGLKNMMAGKGNFQQLLNT